MIRGRSTGQIVSYVTDPVSSLQHVLCADGPVYPSSLWGPSLDQLDHVVERCLLPELAVGDWLLFSNMGACGLEEFSSSPLPVYNTVSTADWWVRPLGYRCKCGEINTARDNKR